MLLINKFLITTSGLLFTLAAAAPFCDTMICVDKVNKCGIKYGGCYVIPECGGKVPDWVVPPCPSTTTKHAPTTTPCRETICVDAISDCGIRFGDCLEVDCGTFPTLTPPPCPSSTTTPKPTATPCIERICIDAVNKCGVGYGGCYDVKCGTKPTLTPPPCPSATSTLVPKDICTICIDAINKCGIRFGDCIDYKCGGPRPTLTSTPACPTPTA